MEKLSIDPAVLEKLLAVISGCNEVVIYHLDKATGERRIFSSAYTSTIAEWGSEVLEEDREQLASDFVSDGCQRLEYRILSGDGAVIHCLDFCAPANGADNTRLLVISFRYRRMRSTGFDFKDREYLERLIESNRDLVHDIRTPLASLMNASELIKRPRGAEIDERVGQIIKTQVVRINELISQFVTEVPSRSAVRDDKSVESKHGSGEGLSGT